jgi:hypothetical protein
MTIQSDPELSAMSQTLQALSPLDADSQTRILSWVIAKLGLKVSLPGGEERLGQRNTALEGDITDRKVREGTINNVTIKLGADSCRTLLVAAAAYLSIYRGMERFTREEWVACAREARMWKNDYAVQTSINVKRLLEAQFVFEKAKDVFAITLDKLKELEEELAK